MKYEVTVIVRELDVRETYLVEAPREGLARTRAIGEYVQNEANPKLSGESVEYVVLPVLPLFAGEWEWNDTLEAYEVGFPAVAYGEAWNGWVTPVVSREVLTALVARNTFLRSSGLPDLDQWGWTDDKTVRVVAFDAEWSDDDHATHLLPNAAGDYDLGTLGYTWDVIPEDARVVRSVVDEGRVREARVREIVERIKTEVIADMDRGVVPAYPLSFSELHDYVDANTYGGLTEDNADFARPWVDGEMDDLNRIQDTVDQWLKVRATAAGVL